MVAGSVLAVLPLLVEYLFVHKNLSAVLCCELWLPNAWTSLEAKVWTHGLEPRFCVRIGSYFRISDCAEVDLSSWSFMPQHIL